ncbi:unnamed protein product [Cercospora beticola]|nr:unnamed protein product [Cercospora beticola]
MPTIKAATLLACLSLLSCATALPKENCSTKSTTTTTKPTTTSCAKSSTSARGGYPPSYPTGSAPVPYPTHDEPDTYPTDAPQEGYPGICPERTVTSTYGEVVTVTVTTEYPYGEGCTSTETATGDCPSTTVLATETAPAATSTVTETPPVVTVIDSTVTPPVVTVTTTLAGPIEKRDYPTCTGGRTKTVTVGGYETTKTVTDYYGGECETVTEPFSCASPTATSITTVTAEPSTITSTLEASTTSVTTTLTPSTVTATAIPTATVNVLRATGVVSIDPEDEAENAIVNSNNMYARLVLIPGTAERGRDRLITFDVAPTSPELASQFTLTGTDLRGTANDGEVLDWIANTYYYDISNIMYFSSSADPSDATYGYPAMTCSVAPDTNLLSCFNGDPTEGRDFSFKDKFTLCTGGGYSGFNPNGNLYITVDPEGQACTPVTIYFEQVILNQIIPPTPTPSGGNEETPTEGGQPPEIS